MVAGLGLQYDPSLSSNVKSKSFANINTSDTGHQARTFLAKNNYHSSMQHEIRILGFARKTDGDNSISSLKKALTLLGMAVLEGSTFKKALTLLGMAVLEGSTFWKTGKTILYSCNNLEYAAP